MIVMANFLERPMIHPRHKKWKKIEFIVECEHEKIWDKIPIMDLTEKHKVKAEPIFCPDCKLYLTRALVQEQTKHG